MDTRGVLTAFYGIVARELQKLWRRRPRLLAGIVRPLIWLFVVGSGVGAIAAASDPEAYRRFMFPGILGMVLLFAAIFGAMSTVSDRELGAIRLLLIAPVSRTVLVLGKVVGGAMTALAQGGLLLLFLPLLVPDAGVGRVALLVGAMLLTALTLAAVSMTLASGVSSLEGFSGAVNFIAFPMLFLSGALYPVTRLPEWLRPLTAANPLTYAIDLMKHALLGSSTSGFGPELPLALDLLVLIGLFLVGLFLAVLLFDVEMRFVGRSERGGGPVG